MLLLNKGKWMSTQVEAVATEISQRVENPSSSGRDRFISLDDFEPAQIKIRRWSSTQNLLSAMKLFEKGDILFARRNPYLRRASWVDFSGICSGDAIVLREKPNIEKGLLTFLLNTNTFWEYAIAYSAGTMSKRLKWRDLAKYTFLLPPIPEQKQIVELFQSIETAIERVEEQEQRLTELRKSLCKGLLSNEPIFGNLLTKENCSTVKFSYFTESIDKHDKHKKDVHRFVGLENIEPEDFTIKTWGNIEDGTTFTKRFQKGDVLFGKRRAYLKKVAVADFDGICSSDILVLRAKQDKMIPELLPFYISADPFIQYAVSTSAGSLSPRTKWKDLGELEVALPDLETQKKILTVMQNVERTRNLLYVQKSNLKKLKQQLLNEILG